MDILIRKHFYDKSLWHWTPSAENWLRLIQKPFVCSNKEEAPLGIYGTLVDKPAINPLTLQPQYIGANIASLYFLQLDYDSSLSIDEWVADNKNLSYIVVRIPDLNVHDSVSISGTTSGGIPIHLQAGARRPVRSLMQPLSRSIVTAERRTINAGTMDNSVRRPSCAPRRSREYTSCFL